MSATMMEKPRSRRPDCATTEPRRQREPCAPLLDARGRRRGRATMPGYGCGRNPRSKGRKYPPQPFTIDDLAALLDGCYPTGAS